MNGTTTSKALLTPVGDQNPQIQNWSNKVSIVGAGSVGTAIAFALLSQKICSNLVLVDKNESLVRGELLDLQNAVMYLDSPIISCSTDYEALSLSRIVIVATGTVQCEEKKDVALRQNTQIFKEVIPNIMRYSPDCILLVCSYPVDEMSYVAWKLSKLPAYKVIGSGTIQESARFRGMIAQKLEVHPSICQAYVIGEHGSRSVPLWSSVSVAGVRLKDINPDLGTANDPENWRAIHKEVISGAKEVTNLKECATWGLGLSITRIVNAILQNTQECFCVSTRIQGCRHGLGKDVFMSLPVIIGRSGIKLIIKQKLNDSEKQQLQNSADRMHELQKSLKLQEPLYQKLHGNKICSIAAIKYQAA